MPGTMFRACNPRGGQRCLYVLRGTVTAHTVRETSWWIFKNRMRMIEIRLNPEHVKVFNQSAQSKLSALDNCHLQGGATILTVGVDDERLKDFPVGALVAVTLGYAGPIQQFFRDSDPLAIIDIRVVTEDAKLENEVEVPQAGVEPT
ncbi:MAG: hypothetical protein Q7S57_02045 [bacterium]|nr:hypothetical protein [bacterium]